MAPGKATSAQRTDARSPPAHATQRPLQSSPPMNESKPKPASQQSPATQPPSPPKQNTASPVTSAAELINAQSQASDPAPATGGGKEGCTGSAAAVGQQVDSPPAKPIENGKMTVAALRRSTPPRPSAGRDSASPYSEARASRSVALSKPLGPDSEQVVCRK